MTTQTTTRDALDRCFRGLQLEEEERGARQPGSEPDERDNLRWQASVLDAAKQVLYRYAEGLPSRDAAALRRAAGTTGAMAQAAILEVMRRTEFRITTGPCPCECNSGGFCGGCGHSGCGAR